MQQTDLHLRTSSILYHESTLTPRKDLLRLRPQRSPPPPIQRYQARELHGSVRNAGSSFTGHDVR
jgi:hypothetical protein